jgi:hypothetical protein
MIEMNPEASKHYRKQAAAARSAERSKNPGSPGSRAVARAFESGHQGIKAKVGR